MICYQFNRNYLSLVLQPKFGVVRVDNKTNVIRSYVLLIPHYGRRGIQGRIHEFSKGVQLWHSEAYGQYVHLHVSDFKFLQYTFQNILNINNFDQDSIEYRESLH